ncbi:hypothetical protein [Aquimarina sp. AU58]|uniref:hypothetical protein n=1 Tax=Aquimarina sp. AU58 TaxID=1874112 RepID=UPI000D6DD6E8|nr:hypothetical protein [Aquimarina sp. AU58]
MNTQEKTDQEETDQEKTKVWLWFACSIVLVLIIFIGYWQINRYWHDIPPTAAEFGDSFGGANAIFSALAFAFLIVTSLLQRKELELQRNELIRSSKAQVKSEKWLNLQTSLTAKQALLNSYQFLYEENLKLSKDHPNSTKRSEYRNAANSYIARLESITQDLEKEQKLFQDIITEISETYGNYSPMHDSNPSIHDNDF